MEADLIQWMQGKALVPYDDVAQILQLASDFVSSEKCVLDFKVKSERVAVALILDKEEKAGAGQFVLVAANKNLFDKRASLDLLESALQRAQDLKLKVFDFCLTPSNPLGEEVLVSRGFQLYHADCVIEGTEEQGYQVLRELAPKPSDPYRLTTVNDSNVKAYHALVKKVFANNEEFPISSEEDFIRLNKNSTIPNYLLYDEGRLVAFLGLMLRAGNVGEIQAVGVDPEYQKQGLGYRLLYECIRILMDNGAKSFVGHVNEKNIAALKLYKRYTRVGGRFATYRLQID